MAPEKLRVWSAQPLPAEVVRSLSTTAQATDVVVVAAMPDVHLAADVCVGAVVATRSTLWPQAVGGDIGCGMAAVLLDGPADALRARSQAAAVMTALAQAVPVTAHRSQHAALPLAIAKGCLSSALLERKKQAIGRVQFATLGRGNHFVEFDRCTQTGGLWLLVHTGSRGIGQAIRDAHPGQLAAESLDGAAYLNDMAWALAYAAASRQRIISAVCEIAMRELGAAPVWETFIDCHHNFVRREHHEGEQLWVHRKGAISASTGEPGIIPGSMGTKSYIVAGRGHARALCSSSHGAGRLMSRTEARQGFSRFALEAQMRGIWFDNRAGDRLRDEAPRAYKDIGQVMQAQHELTKICTELTPVLVYKGV